MKSKFFLQLIILITGILTVSVVQAAPVDERSAVEWADDKGRLLLDTFRDPDIARRYQTLDKVFAETVDLNYVSRFVVGRYWRQMTPVQQQAYQQLFTRYALSSYKTFPLDFVNSVVYKVNGATVDSQFTTVNCVVHVKLNPNDPPQDFLLYFRLHKVDGKIMLVDIKLAESSLILAYRNKFYEMFAANDSDVNWFLEDLETLVQSNEANNRQRLELSENI